MPEILEEVCGWVMSAAKKPVWAKMTPNVTRIEDPSRAALRGGATGLAAINTIRSVMGVNLDTLRPEPAVEGFTTPGGYSSKAVKPIALRMVMEIATMIRQEFPGRSLSGIGGVESGNDAAQFILLGSDTVQVCTGVMKFGYECVKPMCEELLAFMEKHKFETLSDFKGKSLDYFTTHAELVRMQGERKAAQKAAAEQKEVVKADGDWSGDSFVQQSNALATKLTPLVKLQASSPNRQISSKFQAALRKSQTRLESQDSRSHGRRRAVFSYSKADNFAVASRAQETAGPNGDERHPFDLEERTAAFGEWIVRFARTIPRGPANDRLISQLVGAGTSVGANYCEASESVSKKDFRCTIGRCVKEAKETKFFLRLIAAAEPTLAAEARSIFREAKELHLIFAAIFRK